MTNTNKGYSTTTALMLEMKAHEGDTIKQAVERHAFEACKDFRTAPKLGNGEWRWKFEGEKVILEWYAAPRWHAHLVNDEWHFSCGDEEIITLRNTGTTTFSWVNGLCLILNNNPELGEMILKGKADES